MKYGGCGFEYGGGWRGGVHLGSVVRGMEGKRVFVGQVPPGTDVGKRGGVND